jgi:hypothetical protein
LRSEGWNGVLIVLAFDAFVGRLDTVSPSTRVPGRRADVSVRALGVAARRAGIFPGNEDALAVAGKSPELAHDLQG